MNPLITTAVLLTTALGVSANDWPGFHGLEKEGRGDSAASPLHWSSTQNVAWTTPIPGRGHSSPIVSGNAIYLTTAYEKNHSSPIQSAMNYTVLALALVFTMAGFSFATWSLQQRSRMRERLWQHAKFFLFVQVLTGVVVVVIFGRRLLNPDDDAVRQWLVSIMLMLSCLVLSCLLRPAGAWQWLVGGLFSCAFAVPAFLALRHTTVISAFGATKIMVLAVAATSPLVLGLILLTVYFVSRRRRPAGPSQEIAESSPIAMWHFLVTGSIGFVAALAPFFLLLYRAADYHMPDEYLWSTRLHPDVNGRWVVVYAVLTAATVAGGFWRAGQRGTARGLPWQRTFFAAATALAVVSLVRATWSERPKELTCAIVCVHPDNGKVLWICEGLMGSRRAESSMVTHASATPAADGERIYGYFGQDGLMCVSPTGELLWTKTEPLFCGKFGVGTSPVVKDNILVIASDTRESDRSPSFIFALDVVSGQCLWRKERKCPILDAGYGTPLIKSWNGKQVVIVHGWYDVKGYDLKTGEELWSYPAPHDGRHLVASPVSDAERLYLTGGKRVIALDLSKLGTGSDPLVWSKPIAGEKSSTPVVMDGRLFVVTENGMAFCLETRTGDVLWKQRLEGTYLSSVMATADRVFFTGESGQTTVVAIDGQFRQLATNSVGESIYASLVPMGNRLLARTTKGLYCLEGGSRQDPSHP